RVRKDVASCLPDDYAAVTRRNDPFSPTVAFNGGEFAMRPSRRTLLRMLGSGAVVAALPSNIERLLAAPPTSRTGTLADVEHVVILMQENRSFDHYFGTMRGVRGFADPRAVKLPSGAPVWQQPTDAGYVLPYRVNNLATRFLPDPPHGWNDTH